MRQYVWRGLCKQCAPPRRSPRVTVRPAATLTSGSPSTFALVADDAAELRWVVDLAAGTVRRGDGEVECVLTGSAEALAQMLAQEVNPALLLRSGRIRLLSPHRGIGELDSILAVRTIVESLGPRQSGPLPSVGSMRRAVRSMAEVDV